MACFVSWPVILGQSEWPLGTTRMIKPKPCCCECCAAPDCADWPVCRTFESGSSCGHCLSISRQDILSYLETAELSYRTDSSNAKSIYLRNRVRHELLPVLQALAPAAIRMLARQADILRDDDRLLDALAAHRLARTIRFRDSTTLMLDRAALLDTTGCAATPDAATGPAGAVAVFRHAAK